MDGILDEWITFASSIPAAKLMDRKALRNDAKAILSRIAREMEKSQSIGERDAKARGERDTEAHRPDSAAQTHAVGRLSDGFTLPDMVSEYRALRSSVIGRWLKQRVPGANALSELTKFHEGIDQALAESTARFTEGLDRARELFMGALGHDLRTPLQVIVQCTEYLNRPETPTRTHAQMAGYIAESAENIRDMVEDLLDVVKTRLGGSLPIKIESTDIAQICHRAVNHVRLAHPSVTFATRLPSFAPANGDPARLHQLLVNLLKNAVQHGDLTRPIKVATQQDATHVRVSVHNEGKPIDPDLISKIFDPLRRGDHVPEHQRGAGLGLGLYIANAIARAHDGRIEVESEAERGTVFTLFLPRTHAP